MSLFRNKVFVFTNMNHYSHYGKEVYKFGGVVKCQLQYIDKSGFLDMCLDPNVILVNSAELTNSPVKIYLEFNNKRLIDVKEIGMAIAYMDITKFTNPYCHEVLDINELSLRSLQWIKLS